MIPGVQHNIFSLNVSLQPAQTNLRLFFGRLLIHTSLHYAVSYAELGAVFALSAAAQVGNVHV